jgi:hypothetical protein
MTASTDAITSRRDILTCWQCGRSFGNVARDPAKATKSTTDGREIHMNGACDD